MPLKTDYVGIDRRDSGRIVGNPSVTGIMEGLPLNLKLILKRMRGHSGLPLLQIPWSREFSCPPLQHSWAAFF
jgi:hypothetical protein